jgi:hypothetical protein
VDAIDAPAARVTDRDANVAEDARGHDVFVARGTRLDPMPRIPRFGRGEQHAPPDAHAAERQTQPEQTQQLTSGDPLATPAPAPAEPTGPATHGLTSGDPLSEAAPAPPPEPESPGRTEDLLAAAPAEAAPVGDPPTADPIPPADPGPGAEPTSAEPTPAEPPQSDTAPAEPAAGGEEPAVADAPLWSAPGAGEAERPTGGTPPPAPAVFPVEGAGVAGIAAAGAATAGAVGAGGEQPTTVAPPAGVEAQAVEQAPADARPSFRERTRMRRRMRELRRLREIAFRDLGGLTFDLHRFGRERQDLVAEKLHALERIDGELRAIENALGARRPLIELREPGVAACPRCATLHGTDANFCPGCGTPLRAVVAEAGPLRVTPVDQQPAPPS